MLRRPVGFAAQPAGKAPCIALSMTEQLKPPLSNRRLVAFELIRTGSVFNVVETEGGETVVFDNTCKVLVYKGNELKKTLTNAWERSVYSRSGRQLLTANRLILRIAFG